MDALNFHYTPYATPLFLAAAISGGFAWYSLRRRQQREALVFGLLMLALAWWSLCYGITICGDNLQTQYLFNRLKYLGVMTVSPLWLILALQYTHNETFVTRRNVLLLFLPAIVLLPVILANPWLRLWWPEVWVGEFDGHPVFQRSHGLCYYAHVVISYAYVTVGLWLYVRFYRRSSPIYRSQSLLMIIAAVVPLVASGLTQVGLSPLPWGLDPFFFMLSGMIIALAIFRYRFLDIIPFARRTVVEHLPESVLVIDLGGRIVDANPAARAIVTGNGGSIVGQTLDAAVRNPELRQALLEIIQPDSDRPSERDVQISKQEGEQVLSIRTIPLLQGGVGPIGQIVLIQDISERVAVQQELESLYREAESQRERLALTIGTAEDAILLLDEHGKILAQNPAARHILQTGPDDRLPPALQAVLAQAQVTLRETKTQIDLGEQSFHVVVTPIAQTGLVLTMHDVTHFKQLARLKDEFVATVSHDLRAPLTSIVGYAQMIQGGGVSEQKQQEALARIESSAWHMSNLITNLLDLATLEAGIDLNAELVDVGALALVAAEVLEGAALAKGLTLHYEIQKHPQIRVDRQLIIQVWRNLIDNAIKYTEQGSVTIRVETVEGQVLGKVTDTGPGISPANIPYVFDKFFRARQSHATDITGTGLGLSLVKIIVERHGGRIWVESEAGAGSTFAFTLPLAR